VTNQIITVFPGLEDSIWLVRMDKSGFQRAVNWDNGCDLNTMSESELAVDKRMIKDEDRVRGVLGFARADWNDVGQSDNRDRMGSVEIRM